MNCLDDLATEAQAGLMTGDDYLTSLSADVASIAGVGSTSLHARVPSCPDWEVADLIRHVGGFHRYVTYLAELADGESEQPRGFQSAVAAVNALEPNADLVAWLEQGADDLSQALRAATPTKTMRTFYGVHHPALLIRRAATETTVHRWDAAGANGTPQPIEPTLADDAISEFLDVLMPLFFKYDAFAGTGQTIRLEPAGGDRAAWVIAVGPESTTWCRQTDDSASDATVRASASDLYLWFLGRDTAAPVDVLGDAEMPDRWRTAVAF